MTMMKKKKKKWRKNNEKKKLNHSSYSAFCSVCSIKYFAAAERIWNVFHFISYHTINTDNSSNWRSKIFDWTSCCIHIFAKNPNFVNIYQKQKTRRYTCERYDWNIILTVNKCQKGFNCCFEWLTVLFFKKVLSMISHKKRIALISNHPLSFIQRRKYLKQMFQRLE